MEKMPEKRHYTVGNVVKVKSWDRMKREFQLWDDDTIMTPSGEFYSDMRPLCGMVFVVVCVSQTYNGLVWYYLNDLNDDFVMQRLTGHSDWIFTDDMLEPVTQIENACYDDDMVMWFGGWEFTQ